VVNVSFDVSLVIKLQLQMGNTNTPIFSFKLSLAFYKKNKEERYSRLPRLSDTRYSAKGTKGKWRYTSSKARLKCPIYRRYTDLSVMGNRVGVANFFESIDRY